MSTPKRKGRELQLPTLDAETTPTKDRSDVDSILPQEAPVPAITSWTIDDVWDENHPDMPNGMRYRLKRLDRCMTAVGGIVNILVEEDRGRRDQDDNPGVVHKGLKRYQIEALQLAAIELCHDGDFLLEKIREAAQ